MEDTFNLKQNKILKLNSLCIAIFIFINFLSVYLPEALIVDNITLIISGMVFLVATINNKRKIITSNNLITIIVVICLFAYSFLKWGINSFTINNMLFFIMYGMVGLYLSDKEFSIIHVYKYSILIAFMCIPQILIQDIEQLKDQWMWISYSILSIVIICIAYITTSREKSIYKIFSIIILVIISIKIIPISTRGVILSLLVFIVGVLMIFFIKGVISKILVITSFLTFFIITMLNISEILIKINENLISNNIHIDFIQKMINLAVKNNLLNGRNMFYELAISGIQENPMLGKGIGAYSIDTGLNYPHNIFLEISYESGLIVCLIIVLMLIYCLNKIFLDVDLDKQKRVFLWVIFSSCIFRLLVSYTFWMEQKFWFLLGLISIYIPTKRIVAFKAKIKGK